jgi:SAM-dependent methyltransferase
MSNKSPLMRFRAAIWRGRQALLDASTYAIHRLRGGDYVGFYAKKMDRLATHSPERATGTPENRRFQIDYLRTHGLIPDSYMLDLGCGTVAAGVHFVGYLDAGRYVGADISRQCLDVGGRRLAEAGLSNKEAALVLLPGGSLAPLAGKAFDIIWAQSVLTHMPPEDIRRMLTAARSLLRPGGLFYATFAFDPAGVRQRKTKDWYYSEDAIGRIAHETGYDAEVLRDWRHPASAQDKLLKLSPRSLSFVSSSTELQFPEVGR